MIYMYITYKRIRLNIDPLYNLARDFLCETFCCCCYDNCGIYNELNECAIFKSIKNKYTLIILTNIIRYYFMSTILIIANYYLVYSCYYTVSEYNLYVYGLIVSILLCIYAMGLYVFPCIINLSQWFLQSQNLTITSI